MIVDRGSGIINCRILTGVLLSGVLFVLADASRCPAQSPIRRPALSPYLQLLRPQEGPLPNYQNFVEPRIELERTRLQLLSNQRQFEERITQERQAVQEFVTEQARATGARGPATFMNHLHFYPRGAGTAVRRR